MDNRIDRRAFVETLVALPVGLFLVRCSSTTSYTPPEPGAAPTVSGGQAVYTSSVVSDHDHTFGIALTAFANPPSGGVSGDTSNVQNHTHFVVIPAAELSSVQVGSAVVVNTSSAQGHTHAFTFVKVSGPATDGGLVTP